MDTIGDSLRDAGINTEVEGGCQGCGKLKSECECSESVGPDEVIDQAVDGEHYIHNVRIPDIRPIESRLSDLESGVEADFPGVVVSDILEYDPTGAIQDLNTRLNETNARLNELGSFVYTVLSGDYKRYKDGMFG